MQQIFSEQPIHQWDAADCPNAIDTLLGVYSDLCCDNVLVDVDIYLNKFAAIVLGYVNGNCNDLNGKDSEVCEYITNQGTHAIFDNGYYFINVYIYFNRDDGDHDTNIK